MSSNAWWVYIVRCADGSLYTGIARDLDRRIAAHNGTGAAGANYTRARRPVRLVYREAAQGRSAASRREYEIKQLTREEKLALVLRSGAAADEGGDQQ
ncbi:MAG: GIY-YIG nuclease family protein [Betaproteobacteria bacterium]|nr:GIY-YIG nuclease family protein [Betaproteobacteria bacterium]